MITQVRKWGNSLGVRIPKSVAQGARVKEGTSVEMSVENGRVVIVPVKKPGLRLADLVKRINRENRHDETDFGVEVGAEST